MPWSIAEGPDNHELYLALASRAPLSFTTTNGLKVALDLSMIRNITVDEKDRPLSFYFLGRSVATDPSLVAVTYCRQPRLGLRPKKLGLLSVGEEAKRFHDRIVRSGHHIQPEYVVKDGPDRFHLVSAMIGGQSVTFEISRIGVSQVETVMVIPREMHIGEGPQVNVTAADVEEEKQDLFLAYSLKDRAGAAERLW